MSKLAIIGCGEVGRGFAAGAVDAGTHDLTLCDAAPTSAAREFAAARGVVLHEAAGRWLADRDHVWSCVPGDVAASVAEQVIPHMRPDAVFLDLSTASPAVKQAGAGLGAKHGVRYAEGAIMGSVGLTGLNTPLLVSGTHAEAAVQELTRIGAPARALRNGKPGDAVVLKLLRTVITKGLEALGVEALVAAERQGVRHELYEVLSDIDDASFTEFLNAVVRTHVRHAGRRGQEIGRAEAELAELGLPSLVLDGARARFEATKSALHTSPPAEDASDSIDSAVGWLLSTTAPGPRLQPCPPANPNDNT